MKKHPSKKGKLRVSQSLMKDMADYLAQALCGNVMHRKYITNDFPDVPSDSMALGAYFEYVATGGLPKSGEVPKPQMMASGKDMLAPYRYATKNAERVKGYFKAAGIEILAVGEHIVKGRYEGTIDIRVRFTRDLRLPDGSLVKAGTEAVIDLKYSGLIEDRWSRNGWSWTEEQKAYHGIQARQYHYLTGLPFFFFIKDPGDNDKAAFWRVDGFDEFTMDQHKAQAMKVLDNVDLFKEIGWTPYPELERCSQCPIMAECKDRAKFPTLKSVNLSLDVD